MNGFQILSKIGEGTYSTVLKVRRIKDGNIYALKKVKFYKLSNKEKENALNEIRILASINNKNVISYKEAFFDEKDNSLGIVMEYADKGDLFQLITNRKKNKDYFTEEEVWRVFTQLLNGLKALHDLKILHRDIKSANVFLFEGGICKLGDLNVSKVARKGLGYTQTGTPYYASPEVWEEKPYDNKSDVWSLGCVIYEMITLRPPFQANSMDELYKRIMRGMYPKISSRYSEDLSDAIKLMIQVEAGARPNCEELLKMPMITKRIEYFNENSISDDKEEQNGEINKDLGLLKTILIPNRIENLGKNLPKPNYNNERNNRSFERSPNKKNDLQKQYGSLTINTDTLPEINNGNNANNLKKIKNKKSQSLEKKEVYLDEIINKQKPIIERYNDNINNKRNGKKNILLPNLYLKNNSGIYKKDSNGKKNININININIHNRNIPYKILNSENNIIMNNVNLNNIKLIDGKNNYKYNIRNKKNNGYSPKQYLINHYSNDLERMLKVKNPQKKVDKLKLPKKSSELEKKDFLNMLYKRKQRMVYLGKI